MHQNSLLTFLLLLFIEAFSVGQNIATRAKTGNSLPSPDWDSTIQSLYDEVKDFYPQWISPFRAPKYPMTGHYTQVCIFNNNEII